MSILATATTVAALAAPTPGLAGERAGRLAQPLSPTQNAVIENTRITIDEFREAYTSDQVDQRRRAEAFLIGVLDATEGTAWCDYRTFKTITIDERLHSELKRMGATANGQRAATVIVGILARQFPCGRGRAAPSSAR